MIKYLAIYCSDVEKSKDFYSSFGFEMTKEQHGKGPVHYSFNNNGTVFELYPGNAPTKIRLGIKPLKGSEIYKNLEEHPYDIESITIADPDGNKVDIID